MTEGRDAEGRDEEGRHEEGRHEEGRYDVVWPLGRTTVEAPARQVRLPDPAGKTVAFVWDYLFLGDEIFPVIQDELTRHHPDLHFVGWEAFGNIHGPDEPEVRAALPDRLRSEGVDAVIVGIGACGTCTPAVVRACIAAERSGVPAFAVVATGFLSQARSTARSAGMEHLWIAEYPGVIPNDPTELIEQKVRTHVVRGLLEGFSAPVETAVDREVEPEPRDVVCSGTLDEVHEHFERRQWSDGLPIVPPTMARVEAFLRFTDRAPDDVLGVLALEEREATVWNVAVNGVMAGCRPEYMPVLIAAVEAIADPGFKLEFAGSTPGWEPLVILSGTLARDLDFNVGSGLMRVGRRANTSIGRFVRLYMRNVAGFRIPPGDTDKASIAFTFNVAMAEDEAAVDDLGWDPFRVDRGFARSDDVVTVQSVIAISQPIYSGGTDPVERIEPIAHIMADTCGPWAFTGVWRQQFHPLLVMSPAVARAFADDGWKKEDIRRHLYETLMIQAYWFEHYPRHVTGDDVPLADLVADGTAPPRYAESDDPRRLVPLLLREEWTGIVVAGDDGRNQCKVYVNSADLGAPVSKRVVLPTGWRAPVA
jgi:hypothetical protein